MDCIFHEVAKSRTRLSGFHTERSMKGFKAGDCQIPIYLFMAALIFSRLKEGDMKYHEMRIIYQISLNFHRAAIVLMPCGFS